MIINKNETIPADHSQYSTVYLKSPGDEQDDDNKEWDDEDDENFEDQANDRDDLHEIKLDNNILDQDEDDHLPDNDLQ